MGLELYNLPFKNSSGESIPPFSIMQVDEWSEANDRDYFRVRKPNGSGKQYIFNGPTSIASDGDGMGSRSPGIQAAYNLSDGTPVVDQEWGAVSGSWLLGTGNGGFFIVGDVGTVGSVNVVRVSESAASGNVIRATVNAPGTGVLSGDPTGPFDNAIAIVGSAPSGGTGTFQNVYGEAFADNAPILLFQRKDNGNWETEKSGGSSFTPVVQGELIEDKAYADTAKLAKPLNAAGVVDAGADSFYVLDANGRHYGKAPTGGDRGYQFTAILATDDHAGSGLPGYRIIEMEGPAHFLSGVLSGSYSGGGTPFTPSTTQPWGRAQRGRRFPATGDITVMDDDGVASAAQSGDKWIIWWNEAAANYSFAVPMEPAAAGALIKGMAIATVAKTTAIDGTAFTASPGITASAVKKLAWTGSTLDDDGSAAMQAANLTFTDIRASTAEPVLVFGFVEAVSGTDTFVIVWCDHRGTPGYVKANDQILYHAATEANFKLDAGGCT